LTAAVEAPVNLTLALSRAKLPNITALHWA
jgi:hypothetical protein